MTEVAIRSARVGEAEQILKLQYLCGQSEAALYDDYSMPPLTQTLWELLREYDAGEVLVARLGEEVVGSVRGRLEADTCHIGMLVVHPRLQGMGIGTRLMRAIEERFAEAEGYELSVGHLSEGNLRLYRRLGYREFREHTVSPKLRVIHMRKSRESKTPE
jgi:ribosomal protein S18 acetylase RimI-like enzyme